MNYFPCSIITSCPISYMHLHLVITALCVYFRNYYHNILVIINRMLFTSFVYTLFTFHIKCVHFVDFILTIPRSSCVVSFETLLLSSLGTAVLTSFFMCSMSSVWRLMVIILRFTREERRSSRLFTGEDFGFPGELNIPHSSCVPCPPVLASSLALRRRRLSPTFSFATLLLSSLGAAAFFVCSMSSSCHMKLIVLHSSFAIFDLPSRLSFLFPISAGSSFGPAAPDATPGTVPGNMQQQATSAVSQRVESL